MTQISFDSDQETNKITAQEDGALVTRARLVNEKGLHARAATKLSRLASQYDADIMVQYTGVDYAVTATSVLGLLTFGAAKGSELAIQAKGAQAEQALRALVDLIANGFGEQG